MGRSQGDPGAVLDGGLMVLGCSGLRVCDAGAMPSITSGNTAAPVMAMAERCADIIRREWK
jgi:choline dehydrogenase